MVVVKAEPKPAPAAPSRTELLGLKPLPWLPTARSGSESPLKSPTAIERGPSPAPKSVWRGEGSAGGAEQDRDVVA